MLIKCPECQLQISNKAIICPHCGYPLDETKLQKYKMRRNRRKRLPNGFGQITLLKNKNLRKPYRAMITIGKNEYGKPISRLLQPVAYFKTYNEAYEALIKYNKNPLYFDKNITLINLYEDWSSSKMEYLSKSRQNVIKSAFKYVSDLYDLPIIKINKKQLNHYINDSNVDIPVTMRKVLKEVLDSIFDYAISNEYVDRNISREIKLSKEITSLIEDNKKEHKIYTKKEIDTIKNINSIYSDMVFLQCFSGFRPSEILELETKNVDLDKKIMIGGLKTKNGKNRVVPIHSSVFDIVKKYYNPNNTYLFEINGKNIIYSSFKHFYNKTILPKLQFDIHRLHDGRRYFITQCKKFKLDEYAIKYIVGHSITDITEKIYTEREIEWLIEEIEKIKVYE